MPHRPPSWLLTLTAAAAMSATAACSPLYLVRAGYEEAKILSRRQPIERLVADTSLPVEEREKLRLVLEAREFADRGLGLRVGNSYTTFSRLDSDTLALVLSAAYRDELRAHTWWFPIVGRVPYKGFFSESRARAEIASLERRGLDTYLRPTSAFSTLGWFNDPLVSPLLRYDSVSLANTVIHELFHNTLYLPGQALFNESFAQFVGSRGAIALFCGRDGDDAPTCTRARDGWHDELVFGAFLSELVAGLQEIYQDPSLTREEKLVLREARFELSRDRFVAEVQPRLRVSSYASFTATPLNNATLIARRLYYYRLDLFERVHERLGGDLRRTIETVVAAARETPDDPYAAVEKLLGSSS